MTPFRKMSLAGWLLLVAAACSDPVQDPVLSRMEPDRCLQNEAKPVDIMGEHFRPRVVISYQDRERSELDVTFTAFLDDTELPDVVYRDANLLEAQVPGTLAPAVYTLRVTDPSGRTVVLTDAFTVLAPGECLDDRDCDDADACTLDSCVEDRCRYTDAADGTDCEDDGNECTGDACLGGACSHPPVVDDTVCDDGDRCTRQDACQAGSCAGADPVVCTPLDACHQAGGCDPATGLCDDPVWPDGTPCDDGDACSSVDSCQAGVCTGGTVDLDADGDTYLDASCPGGDDCDDADGLVHPGASEEPAAGSSCTDGIDNDCDGLTDLEEMACEQNWWDASWSRRHRIVFDNSAQVGALVDFPVLVSLDALTIDVGLVSPGGADLRFLDEDGSTVLAHEIEHWDAQGTSHVWVKVPRIDAGSVADHIWLYYGNPVAGDGQNPNDVWTAGYAGVFHLNDSLDDSTENANHGTNAGSTSAPGWIAGGRGFEFDNAEEITIGDTGFAYGAAPRTICAWVAPSALDAPVKHWYISYGEFVSQGGFFIGRVGTELWCGGVGDDIIAADIFSLDTWGYHCCVVGSGNGVRLFSDGDQVAGPESHPTWSVAPGESLIGGHINPGPDEHWDGRVDEVRISSTMRTADWNRAEYLSMTGAFATVGPAESY